MAKNGNGEGSIYPHKKNGKKVGYRGAYWVHGGRSQASLRVGQDPRRSTRQAHRGLGQPRSGPCLRCWEPYGRGIPHTLAGGLSEGHRARQHLRGSPAPD